MTESESKLKLTPVKIDLKTKEITAIQNITFIDLESARNYVSSTNASKNKGNQGVWILAIHSKINSYLKGNETVQSTFVR